MSYVAILLAGLATSFHCVGMCGPLAIAVGSGRRRWLTQTLYNLGRINALVAIGALSGALGATILASAPVRIAERLLAVVAGIAMLLVALEALGLGGKLSRTTAHLVRGTWGRALGDLMRSRSAAAPIAFGIFNAFLPCQLIYAFAARAASTASVIEGMLTMLAFGLGTVPAMMITGLGGGYVSTALRQRLSIATAVLVLLFSLMMIGRGLGLELHSMYHAGHVH